ncbi:glycoside hydrolase/deacetylase, partial [Neoconidiobolus thromboides FSU 785]
MTFDDGPYAYTRQLLKILRRMDTKATFFVVGEMVDKEEYGSILQEVAREGHQVASHSYTHPHLNTLTDEQLSNEISKTSDAIFRRIGKRVNYFRCPYGECDDRVLGKLFDQGYRVIDWNLDTLDWTGKSPREIIGSYRDGIQSESTSGAYISLQHDIQPNTIAVVSQLIKVVREKGYRLTTVAECMGE